MSLPRIYPLSSSPLTPTSSQPAPSTEREV